MLSVNPTHTGIEIWTRYDGGREGSYRVNDPSFSAREGHQLTAILCGVHPVAIINRNTNIKIQLLNGYDLLGSGPEIKSRSLASHRVQIAGMTPHFPKEFSMFWRNPTKTV